MVTEMTRIVAVHGNNGFARDWPASAMRLGLEARQVNALAPGLWQELDGCEAFLWSVNQDDPTDLEFARSILLAVKQRGLRVFPDHATAWHFDDKVAQKYLLESVDAPLADTWTFFSRRDAIDFLESAHYPLVFKLRRGAGSLNVRLVRDVGEGKALVARMFGRGMSAHPVAAGASRALQRARQSRPGEGSLAARARRAARALWRKVGAGQRERGYVLLQRFVPDNDRDVRVTVIGERAFVFFRGVRPNDFRASGSGRIVYPGPTDVPLDMVEEAFRVTRAIGSQAMAFDFVRDVENGRPLLLEISFTFVRSAVEACAGYLTPELEWREGSFRPADLTLGDLMEIGV